MAEYVRMFAVTPAISSQDPPLRRRGVTLAEEFFRERFAQQ